MFRLFTDGSSLGNPGQGGSGGVLYWPDGKMETFKYSFTKATTNNIAEYTAVIKGLELAQKYKIESLAIYTDSKLVVNQVKGYWKINAPHLLLLKAEISKLLTPTTTLEWVPRNANKVADKLAKEAALLATI